MCWRDDALCAGLGTGLWFSHSQTKSGRHAISICNICPVRKECLDEVNKLEGTATRRVGIWGGIGPYDRAAVSKSNTEALEDN